MRAAGAVLGLAIWLAGCASIDAGAQRLVSASQGGDLGVDAPRGQALMASDAPKLAAWFPDLGDKGALLALDGTRDGVSRWRSVDNRQIYTRDGIIIGTRGLADDLMSADVPRLADLVRSERAGQSLRVARFLDGSDLLQIRSWVCVVAPAAAETIQTSQTTYAATRRIDERCSGPNGVFTNHYWVAQGRVIQGVEVISPTLGRIKYLFMP